MSDAPTGRITGDGGSRTLTITREFRAPIEDVWAAVTEPEDMESRECDPPHVLRVTSSTAMGQWFLDLVLEERDGRTVLTFSQPDIDPEQAENIGPGWEYYRDQAR